MPAKDDREHMLNIARGAARGANRPKYNTEPATFVPDPWVIDAMIAAYRYGRAEKAIETLELLAGTVSKEQLGDTQARTGGEKPHGK